MFNNIIAVWPEIVTSLGQTLYMMVVTLTLAILIGTPLGTLLYFIRPGSASYRPKLYIIIDGIINLIRSFPFLILLVAIIPFTRLIVGTAIGTTAVIVPLTICAIPEVARLIEQTLLEVDKGVIEAAEAMGANQFQIVWKVLYLEARSGIANVITIISVGFLGYSTVAGLVGGGGIGDFAIRYGYYRYQMDIMFATVLIIVILVQIIQTTGNFFVRRLDKRR